MSIKVGDKVRHYYPIEDTDGDDWRKSDEVAIEVLTVVKVDGDMVTASGGDTKIEAHKAWFIKVRQ